MLHSFRFLHFALSHVIYRSLDTTVACDCVLVSYDTRPSEIPASYFTVKQTQSLYVAMQQSYQLISNMTSAMTSAAAKPLE